MEFFDEIESRPRFLFQSRNLPRTNPDHAPHHSSSPYSFLASLHRPTLAISLTISIAIFVLLILRLNFDPYKSILLWISLSFLVGPFAPPRLTAGDIRVGLGPPLEGIPDNVPAESDEKSFRKSITSHRKAPEFIDSQKPTTIGGGSSVDLSKSNQIEEERAIVSSSNNNKSRDDEENEWNEIDEELLRKLMAKLPVGMPGRWDAIAEGFKGKHKVETVIAKAKESGLRKASDRDSYEKFLKTRKPVDKRVLEEEGKETNGEIDGEWSSAEDLALLNALKAFPKDVGMRWEKIAASVPGKTKSACMKRVAVLKKDFRSSKGSTIQAS